MKASEALRRGSTMVEPVANYIDKNRDGAKCCALGMIGKAAVGNPWGVGNAYPWIKTQQTRLPCDCQEARVISNSGQCATREEVESGVWNTVTHLFNYHVMTEGDWTVNQIADWLDTVDPSNVSGG